MLRREGSLALSLSLFVALSGSMSVLACDAGKAPAGDAKSAPAKPDAKAAPGEPAAPSEPEVTPVLTLGAAKIMREGHADRAIMIETDGKVTMAGIPFGVLYADGRMTNPQGELLMTASGDGSVLGTDGPVGIKLDATGGELDMENLHVKLTFLADGGVTTETTGSHAGLLGTDSPQLRAEGCTGPLVQACALITLNYLMALGNPDSVQEIDAP